MSLGTLFAACQWADLVWPTLVLLGVERVEIDPGNTVVTPLRFISYPYSHSLAALLLWAIAAGGAYWWISRSKISAGIVVGALVLSHWILDGITHRADMPLTIGGASRLGLGLWNSVSGTVIVEGATFVIGVIVYLRATEARDRVGALACWGLVAFLLIVYGINLVGPPPPSAAAVAWSAEAMWLLVVWGYWVDAHRKGRRSASR